MSTPANENGLFTEGPEKFSGKVNSIPLSDVDSTRPGETSLGDLVSNATSQISTLVRSEIELAKTEIAGEVKKGAIGGGLFAVAGVIALYSSFFFFFFLAELLDLWLDRWAAFLIVFLLMLVIAAVAALIGWNRFKKIQKPKATIDSVSEMKNLVPGKAQKKIGARNEHGLYT
ncbi:phage holin family protein [Corynebacterium tapiri]|uniref:Phage holin family protein n=1 Tax=Corynebacterium tapiri TaxID=1448266 RepID=A0A5C4U4S1_9CORY|nr:phage holin family protein [Corynebacterium tapiri]TNL97353.1 phage holin family protein [Corynebacterium tapiri]